MNFYFITGTSTGIGAALAEELLHPGNRIHGFSRRGNEQLVEKGMQSDLSFADHQVDLAQPSGISYCSQLWRRLPLEQATSINLILNAASVEPVGLIGTKAGRYGLAEALHLNLESPIHLCHNFVEITQPLPVPKRILFISSGAARKAYPGWGIYCSVKAGAEMFMQVLANEQKNQPHPISVASMAPGVVDTEMQTLIRTQDEAQFPILQRFLDLKTQDKLWPPTFVAQHLITYLHGDSFGNPVLDDLRNRVS